MGIAEALIQIGVGGAALAVLLIIVVKFLQALGEERREFAAMLSEQRSQCRKEREAASVQLAENTLAIRELRDSIERMNARKWAEAIDDLHA